MFKSAIKLLGRFKKMKISFPEQSVKNDVPDRHFSHITANYISGLAKRIDKYLRKSFLGKSQLDWLLEDHLKQGAEQIYLAYKKPLTWFLQSKLNRLKTGCSLVSKNAGVIGLHIDANDPARILDWRVRPQP
jgi:hypothetical protein